MTIKTIIFDFDGTIADTYQTLITITNNLANEFGYAQISPEELLELKQLSSREILRKSKISWIKIPFLLKRGQAELNKLVVTLKPINGIEKSLEKLKERGYYLGIITSNSYENVQGFLENNQLKNIFDFIYPSIPLFRKHNAIKKFINKHGFKPEEVIYVGDETRDIEAARKCKVKIASVSWGFSDKFLLEQYNPDFLLDCPKELLTMLDSDIDSNDSETVLGVNALI